MLLRNAICFFRSEPKLLIKAAAVESSEKIRFCSQSRIL